MPGRAKKPGSRNNILGDQLAGMYGTSREQGEAILDAYEESGEIAPKTLRRFGITEGNRQTLLLGMMASQLVNPYKYHIYPGSTNRAVPSAKNLSNMPKRNGKERSIRGNPRADHQ